MSKASYKRNQHIYWNVLCTYKIGDVEKKYLFTSYSNSLKGSIQEAKNTLVWGKHPSFKARVVGIRYE